MNDVFGIDLGTTYSAIAYINENGQPEVVRTLEDEATTPSVVCFESATNAVVGTVAKNGAVIEHEDTVSLVKRLMGTDYEAEYHGLKQTPESISALILKELVRVAREQTRIDSNRVVITVPAYFGIREKEATRQAGAIAGLDVVGIVTEPVAAALSYGFGKGEPKTLFVYDLGGGTFDTTVMKTSTESIDVIVVDGNQGLGGADWDQRLIEHLAEKFSAQAGIEDDPMEDDAFVQKLTEEAEAAKKKLTTREEVPVILTYGDARERLTVTRAEFEQITSDLLEATLEKVDATLSAAREREQTLNIDEVLLVGGSSKMPAVMAAMKDRYGWEPRLHDPDLAVAKGAAIYGLEPDAEPDPTPAPDGTPGAERREIRPGRPQVNNVLSKALGVMFWDEANKEEYVHFLAEQQAPLPKERLHQPAFTSSANATSIEVRIFEQNTDEPSRRPQDNNEVTPATGAVFTNLPMLPKGSPIDIYLTIDAEGAAFLEAFEPASNQRLEMTVKMSVMQPEEEAEAIAQGVGISTTS